MFVGMTQFPSINDQPSLINTHRDRFSRYAQTNYEIIGSDNVMSLVLRQTITWTDVDNLSMEHWEYISVKL